MLFSAEGARRRGPPGEIATPRGVIRTPAFMPVGTARHRQGHVARDVRATGADIILANTYHLMLRPGAERIAKLGGLHRFMHWDGPDPDRLRRLSGHVAGEAPPHRRSRASPSSRISTAPRIALTPERAIEVQCLLGSDIQMVLDECTPLSGDAR